MVSWIAASLELWVSLAWGFIQQFDHKGLYVSRADMNWVVVFYMPPLQHRFTLELFFY